MGTHLDNHSLSFSLSLFLTDGRSNFFSSSSSMKELLCTLFLVPLVYGKSCWNYYNSRNTIKQNRSVRRNTLERITRRQIESSNHWFRKGHNQTLRRNIWRYVI